MYDKNLVEQVKNQVIDNITTIYEFINNSENHYNNKLQQLLSIEEKFLLNENEVNIMEGERINNHNNDIFSPNIRMNSNENSDISVKEYNDQLQELNNEKVSIISKIQDAQNATICLESIVRTIEQAHSDNCKTLKNIGINFLESQEKERQRIAVDLHDTAIQNLTGLIHKIELCMKLIDMDTVRTKLELSTITDVIRLVISDMRNTIYNLKPMSLEDLGLVLTLERYAKLILSNNDIVVKINTNKENIKLNSIIDLTLFRVIQEACQNIIKHAKASEIEISLLYSDEDVTVIVKDNGKGFDIYSIENPIDQINHFGISIMKEKIELLSGKFTLQSEIGKGTVITAWVPIK